MNWSAPAHVDVCGKWRDTSHGYAPFGCSHWHRHACGFLDGASKPLESVNSFEKLVFPEEVDGHQWDAVFDGQADEAQASREEGLLLIMASRCLLFHSSRLYRNTPSFAKDGIHRLRIYRPRVGHGEDLTKEWHLEEQGNASPKPFSAMGLTAQGILAHEVRGYVRDEAVGMPGVEDVAREMALQAFTLARSDA
eukprot:CAMPEP_0197670104 /NCGR_PEP_ID=MMETSP1338-20131121/73744_1 /TAXON_ID=43686 ORGANISM="Pelagodinium beii, Strain RCC1491" /NCGR_SAMPLE_ID=MMETSP1338 /ASSEMBLY_ACC=CAM_ASM_000754 /LENGTH=193 /DNA_ID=CAMNT_0043249803 /DNA_START=183 /DNA_END=761 /DNA_ORIENTATION=-